MITANLPLSVFELYSLVKQQKVASKKAIAKAFTKKAFINNILLKGRTKSSGNSLY